MAEVDALLRKLDRPPGGANWARFLCGDVSQTCRAILAFALGQPRFNYQTGYAAIKDRIELGISLEQAKQITSRKGAPAGRKTNTDLVEAFFEYDQERRYSASNSIGFDRGYFRVSREVEVPISPLSIIRENGCFVPIFVTGWSENPLHLNQRRLVMTVYEDAFLSLTDYQNAPAEILFFPRDGSEKKTRRPEVWRRGDYELMSPSELAESVDIFLAARQKARELILERYSKASPDTRTPTQPSSDQADLLTLLLRK